MFSSSILSATLTVAMTFPSVGNMLHKSRRYISLSPAPDKFVVSSRDPFESQADAMISTDTSVGRQEMRDGQVFCDEIR